MKLQIRHKEKNYRFFTRMLFLCSSLLLFFSIISGIFIGSLSSKYETSQFLRTYDLAMVNLSETFSGHMEAFASLLGKLLTSSSCDESLCRLLEADSYDNVPANTRNQTVTLLSSLCSDNRYIRGALLFSSQTGNLYYYSSAQLYLNTAHTYMPFHKLIPYENTILGTDAISDAIAACTKDSSSFDECYGFAATLFRHADQPLGFFIPLYSASELEGVLNDYQLSENTCFQITGSGGDIYFHSSTLPSEHPGRQYANTLFNNRYRYRVSYTVSHAAFSMRSTTKLILLLAVFVTFFSFLLYYITYYLSNRNINHILNGMKKFNLQNLSYRIERSDKRNEFSQIIDGFNLMCQELQKNVERSYIYELQQKKSELYALQTSINPHFLYNTLDMVRAQILSQDTSTASKMLLLLAKIYRSQTGTDMFITLADETELCENFILLYQGRFRNFDYEFDVDDSVCCFAVPKNTLQPMIENYFVHGIDTSREDNLLSLSIYPEEHEDGMYIHVILENNGKPISQERIEELNEKFRNGIFYRERKGNFALTNVYNRMKIAFSERFQFLIRSSQHEMCFQIELTFPALSPEDLMAGFTEEGGNEYVSGSHPGR